MEMQNPYRRRNTCCLWLCKPIHTHTEWVWIKLMNPKEWLEVNKNTTFPHNSTLVEYFNVLVCSQLYYFKCNVDTWWNWSNTALHPGRWPRSPFPALGSLVPSCCLSLDIPYSSRSLLHSPLPWKQLPALLHSKNTSILWSYWQYHTEELNTDKQQ